VSDVIDLRPSAVIGAKPFAGTNSLRSAKNVIELRAIKTGIIVGKLAMSSFCWQDQPGGGEPRPVLHGLPPGEMEEIQGL